MNLNVQILWLLFLFTYTLITNVLIILSLLPEDGIGLHGNMLPFRLSTRSRVSDIKLIFLWMTYAAANDFDVLRMSRR